MSFAVTHGIAHLPGGGRIRITATGRDDHVVLTVEDDGPGLDPAASSQEFGVGLGNTRDRLEALYGDGQRLTLEPASTAERPGLRVSLSLPMPDRQDSRP